jgi:hypothetical protein
LLHGDPHSASGTPANRDGWDEARSMTRGAAQRVRRPRRRWVAGRGDRHKARRAPRTRPTRADQRAEGSPGESGLRFGQPRGVSRPGLSTSPRAARCARRAGTGC